MFVGSSYRDRLRKRRRKRRRKPCLNQLVATAAAASGELDVAPRCGRSRNALVAAV